MIPTAWHLLEARIQEHPNEAREVNQDGDLPIHRVLRGSFGRYDTPVPLSVVELLIDTHPEGLGVQEEYGRGVPLHFAVKHPDIACFRAVLYNGSAEATVMQNRRFGNTPLHYSTWSMLGLARMWELLCYNRECVLFGTREDRTALQLMENHYRHIAHQTQRDAQRDALRRNAKKVLLAMATRYNHVPEVPSDEMIAIVVA